MPQPGHALFQFASEVLPRWGLQPEPEWAEHLQNLIAALRLGLLAEWAARQRAPIAVLMRLLLSRSKEWAERLELAVAQWETIGLPRW